MVQKEEDPVSRSIGHLLVEDRLQEAQPAYRPQATESTTSLTPPSTRSSISIPTTEPEPTNLPPPSLSPIATGGNVSTIFACIKLQLNDTLIVRNFPPEATNLIRATITKTWARGLQKDEPLESGYENRSGHVFKLKGNPFFNSPQSTIAVGESVPACRLIAALLDQLSRAGWVLSLSSGTAVGMRQHKPTLIFRYQDPAPAPQQWAILSIMQVGIMDTLRVIDAPAELYKDLQVALEDVGMTSRHGRSFEGVYDIELGRFKCTTDNVDVQELMLVMLEVLDRHGYTVAASLDQAWDYGKPDTWYACKAQGWTPGMPVFHR